MEPLISVIIPAYNCEKFVAESVASILGQTYQNLEVLIADDGSADATKKVIDNFKIDKRVKIYHNASNLGYLKTCNKLLGLAQGNYIAFQDADDISAVNRFETQLREFGPGSNVGAVGCGVIRINNNKENLTPVIFPKSINKTLKQLQFEFVAGTFIVKKEVFDKIGYYNSFFNRIGFEDFYWTIEASEYFELRNVSEALYYYRMNPKSISTMLNPETMSFSFQSVLYLLKQRLSEEKDYLQRKKPGLLRSEVYLKLATLSALQNQHFKATKNSLRALILDPFSLYKAKSFFRFVLKFLSSNFVS